MAITLTAAYLAELKKGENKPDVILEVALDGGTQKWGFASGNGFSDVLPIVKSVSSLQNKLDTKAGYSTRGQMTLVIVGRDNFKTLVQNNYLKNRRVTRKEGFIAPGFAYSDYASTFTGKIIDISRKGDELTVTVADDLVDASKNIPVENSTKTQYIDYRNTHPVDIMTNILLTQLGIAAGIVDSAQFTSERDLWLNGWKFDRVITEPKEANEYLNELQIETNSFIVHDGEKITFKVFAPPVPGQTVEEWTDDYNILEGSLACKSGYKDAFFNRIIIYYDYAETGSDKEEDYEAAVIAADLASQDSGQWNEVATKVIKSKWIRTRTYNQPTNVTGVKLYHVSRNNGTGSGTLTYDNAADTLTWTPPGGTVGETVKVTKDGKFQVFGSDKTKWVRVVVTYASLPTSNQNDAITVTALSGEQYATTVAQKLLNRYRDPVSTVALEVDINNAAYNSVFIKPTDLKDLTTDEAFEKGDATWNKERVMLTSVRPDVAGGKVAVEAIETRMYRRYGFIAPAGFPDYAVATAAQRERAFIGRAADNKVYDGAAYVDGYYIW